MYCLFPHPQSCFCRTRCFLFLTFTCCSAKYIKQRSSSRCQEVAIMFKSTHAWNVSVWSVLVCVQEHQKPRTGLNISLMSDMDIYATSTKPVSVLLTDWHQVWSWIWKGAAQSLRSFSISEKSMEHKTQSSPVQEDTRLCILSPTVVLWSADLFWGWIHPWWLDSSFSKRCCGLQCV